MSALYKRHHFASASVPERSDIYASDLPSVLRRWHEPGCRLALWHRQPAPDFVRRLDRLSFDELPSARFTSTPEEAGRKLHASLLASALSDAKLIAALSHDMAHLVALFAGATSAGEVDVRIEAVRDDACRKFHADVTPGRLVTTYVGPGTVWVLPENAADALSQQDGYAGPVQQMPRFSVGIMGGSEMSAKTLVHRSPRISGTDAFRLFFCVDRPVRLRSTLH